MQRTNVWLSSVFVLEGYARTRKISKQWKRFVFYYVFIHILFAENKNFYVNKNAGGVRGWSSAEHNPPKQI